jgi:hypothetical protein
MGLSNRQNCPGQKGIQMLDPDLKSSHDGESSNEHLIVAQRQSDLPSGCPREAERHRGVGRRKIERRASI